MLGSSMYGELISHPAPVIRLLGFVLELLRLVELYRM